jgi:putative membrane protein
VGYHHICESKIKQMRNGVFKWTSNQLRLWNELATIFLFAIVFLAVKKDALSWVFGVVGIVSLGVILMIAVKIYKRYREKK